MRNWNYDSLGGLYIPKSEEDARNFLSDIVGAEGKIVKIATTKLDSRGMPFEDEITGFMTSRYQEEDWGRQVATIYDRDGIIDMSQKFFVGKLIRYWDVGK